MRPALTNRPKVIPKMYKLKNSVEGNLILKLKHQITVVKIIAGISPIKVLINAKN